MISFKFEYNFLDPASDLLHSLTSFNFSPRRMKFFLLIVCFFLSGVLASPIDSCPKLAPHPPAKTIDELRPDDIKVVLAMGDSITAAFALEGFDGGI
jgi:hypothetical protein